MEARPIEVGSWIRRQFGIVLQKADQLLLGQVRGEALHLSPMVNCPRCGCFLYVEADPDGESYYRCLLCARPWGLRARDPAITRPEIPGLQRRRRR
jgi:hypothetical protein